MPALNQDLIAAMSDLQKTFATVLSSERLEQIYGASSPVTIASSSARTTHKGTTLDFYKADCDIAASFISRPILGAARQILRPAKTKRRNVCYPVWVLIHCLKLEQGTPMRQVLNTGRKLKKSPDDQKVLVASYLLSATSREEYDPYIRSAAKHFLSRSDAKSP